MKNSESTAYEKAMDLIKYTEREALVGNIEPADKRMASQFMSGYLKALYDNNLVSEEEFNSLRNAIRAF